MGARMDIDPEVIIASVAAGDCARALLRHERNKKIVNTSGAYYYLDQQGKYCLLSGLLPRLHAVFWPHSSIYRQMASQPGGSGSRKRKRSGEAAPAPQKKGRFQGIITGTRVHRQLRDFLVLDAKNFKKVHGALHPYCSRLLACIIDRMKWHVFLPEFDVYDAALHIGTSVDMMGLTRDGDLVLMEFKTGYKNYFDNADGHMACSLSGMRNTPMNQATLQLTSAAQILHTCYGVPLERMLLYVMRIDDESLDIIPVDRTFVKRVGPLIYRDLLNYELNKSVS